MNTCRQHCVFITTMAVNKEKREINYILGGVGVRVRFHITVDQGISL